MWSVAFSPDERTLASGASDDTVRLWDSVTGAHLDTLTGHTDDILSVAFSPDGNTIVAGSDDDTIRPWDVAAGEPKPRLEGHTDWVNSVTFSADGTTLASGSSDGSIRLWDAVTGEPMRTFRGHTNRVWSISFTPDGTTLASGSEDGTVLLWQVAPPIEPETEPPPPPILAEDVNKNGVVNILDLTLVALRLGQTGQNDADVNGDGVVNIADLVQVAGVIGNTAAAPAIQPLALETLTAANVENWLTQAQGLNLTNPRLRRGIVFLEQLLAALTPEETALLPNYPNPFNPETWIPYHLAHPADVTLTIYDTNGTPVRQFNLGYQPAGYYADRVKAAYWDGRNNSGESVSSGVYFYQLRAGEYTALRRMVILK